MPAGMGHPQPPWATCSVRHHPLSEKLPPDIQPKPPLPQFKTIPPCPITIHPRKQPFPLLFIHSLQVLEGHNEVSPEPSLSAFIKHFYWGFIWSPQLLRSFCMRQDPTPKALPLMPPAQVRTSFLSISFCQILAVTRGHLYFIFCFATSALFKSYILIHYILPLKALGMYRVLGEAKAGCAGWACSSLINPHSNGLFLIPPWSSFQVTFHWKGF